MGERRDPEQDKLLVHVVLNPRDDGTWAGIAVDYTVVGTGDSPEAATKALEGMLIDYLNWCLADGMTLEQARRPISRSWRSRLFLRRQRGRVFGSRRRIGPQLQERDVAVLSPC
jgi:hypothetical protein